MSRTGWGWIEPLLPKKPGGFAMGRRGSKQHLLVDGSGIPLARTLTGARNDITSCNSRRRLLLRTDRRHETHEALFDLACCLICWRRVETRSVRGGPLVSPS